MIIFSVHFINSSICIWLTGSWEMFVSEFNPGLDPSVSCFSCVGAEGSEASREGDAVGAVGAWSSSEVAPAHARGGGSILQHQEAERRVAAVRRQRWGKLMYFYIRIVSMQRRVRAFWLQHYFTYHMKWSLHTEEIVEREMIRIIKCMFWTEPLASYLKNGPS